MPTVVDYLITLGAIALGASLWLWVLRRYDRIEPEAVRHLVGVALFGGFISVAAAALLNEFSSSVLGVRTNLFENPFSLGIWRLVLFSLLVGFTEEIAKAVAAVFTTRRFGDLNEPVDAMIYAMTVGLGFAAFENVLYATQFGNEVLLVRFLWPVPAHMAYAALWGYGLTKARYIFPEKNQFLVLAPYVILAAVVHAATNFLLFSQGTLTTGLSLAILLWLALLTDIRLKRLVAESPFLEPGECPVCRNLNSPDAEQCVHCGEPLHNTEIFVNCPCGRTKVNVHAEQCPVCGLKLEASGVQTTSRWGGP